MYFFFSYSRQNNESFLCDFFNDLNKEIKQLVGAKEDAGFFDQTGLEPGDFWVAELDDALRKSRVFVAAVTAAYAKSDYCGKEWAAFQNRLKSYAESEHIELPALILPILWVPSMAPLPAEITERQYKLGNPDADHNKNGLVRFYKLKQRYEEQRVDFVSALAQHIITLHNEHSALDKIDAVSELGTIRSAFDMGSEPLLPRENDAPQGPKRVYFVFGAAKPQEIGQAGKQEIAPYRDVGGADWKPFLPAGNKRIGLIAKQIAALDELDFWSEELPITANLSEDVQTAENQRELVVLFVDRWTTRLPWYQQTMQKFDRQNYANCCVLVPWNDNDPESVANDQLLMNTLRNTFRFRVRNQNDLYYRAAIKSEEELRKQLVDVLTRLRADVINKSDPDPGVIPSNGGTRPLITGPRR